MQILGVSIGLTALLSGSSAIGPINPVANGFTPSIFGDFSFDNYEADGVTAAFADFFEHSRADGSTIATYVDSDGGLQTVSTAGEARDNNHYWNGSRWVRAFLVEEASTQLLHTTNALVTQSVTVSAQVYTLHFTGSGTVTLSGASTSGPLVGTGSGERNRVSLPFTPSAGSLTLTVSGDVANAQLEAGVRTSYIANTAGSGTVTRAADVLTLPVENVPFPLSDELVTNGDFSDGSTGWTLNNTEISGGEAIWASDPQDSFILQNIMTSGRTYKVSITVSSYTSGDLEVRFGGSGTDERLFISGPGVYELTKTATGTAFLPLAFGNGTTLRLSNVSVKEVVTPVFSFAMSGALNYNDNNSGLEFDFFTWIASANERVRCYLDTNTGGTGGVVFAQTDNGVVDAVLSGSDALAPGINVPFFVAMRSSSTVLNGALDGTSFTEDTTPTGYPAIQAADIRIAPFGSCNVETFRLWNVDIENAGIEDAS